MRTQLAAIVGIAFALWITSVSAAPDAMPDGQSVYEYFCYQCHGYAGDGRTVAAAYLDPKPRNFAATSPRSLTRATMLQTLERGVPGTAMKSFVRVLDARQRTAVVDYIRSAFMQGAPGRRRYHTPENGWTDHDKASAAFPFATGETPLDTPPESLGQRQREGRRLFLSACVSCHEGARRSEGALTWDRRALSFPRSVETCDGCHESARLLVTRGDSPHGKLDGADLFRRNCAFCHGTDGSGRNWIGTFLEPHARDLRESRIAALDASALTEILRNGLPGTSMPAWKGILSDAELFAVAGHVRALATAGPAGLALPVTTVSPAPVPPGWAARPRGSR